MTSSLQLPIIDLSRSKTHRDELAQQVVDGLENVGFLFLDNVEGLDYDRLFECCQWFFSQPEEIKTSIMRNHWNPENKNVFRGYFPVVPLEPSRKEGFEFARDVPENDPSAKGNWMYENSVWPKEDGRFPFKEYLKNLYELMHETCMEVLRLAAKGIGIPENSFEHFFFEKPITTFRIMHYPPWDETPPDNALIEDGKVLITPEHSDTGFMTLLATFNYKGLEIVNAEGKWEAVEPRPTSLIMNIGDTFSKVMGGRFKATRHRVIDIGVDRYTVPFFLEPRFDADIGVNVEKRAKGEEKENVVVKYGPWVLHRMKHERKYFEYKVLPEIEA